MPYDNISFVPPKSVQENAAKALKVRAEKPASQRGMTPVGIARARDLSNGKSVSPETIRRMVSYFTRHEVDKKGSTWSEKGKGWQAWYGWGGDEGYSWAKKVLGQMQKQDQKTMTATTQTAGVFIKPNVSGAVDQVMRTQYNMAESTGSYTPVARSNVQVAITGSFQGHPQGSFTFSKEVFGEIVDNFYSVSNPILPVDYEHVSGANGSIPAIGWVTGLYIKPENDNLYAWVDWVDEKTVQLIKDGQYLFISPTVNFAAIDPKTGEDIGAKLISISLTNTPFLKDMEPVTIYDNTINKDGAYLSKKDTTMDIISELQSSMSGSASSADMSEEEVNVSVSVGGEEEMAPEDKSMLLLEVVQSSLMLALDAGISPDSKQLSFTLEDNGDVSVVGIDQEGSELSVAVPMADILAVMEE